MKHYCKDHRGDESVYDPINCDLCKAEREAVEAQAAMNAMAELVNMLEQRIAELEAVLTEIAKGEGAFSRDRLTHAENCVDNMKDLARNALAHEKEGE